MPITSKNISTNDLQLYLENDISEEKKKIIFKIENKNNDGKNLTTHETKLIKELNILRNVDNYFAKAINNQPSMPEELQNEIDKTLNIISAKKPSLIESFFTIKHLISSGFGALAAISAMMLFTVVTPTVMFRDVVFKNTDNVSNLSLKENSESFIRNTPNSWLIKSDIAFALLSKQKKIDVNAEVKVKLGDTLIFKLIPLESKIVDIKIISNNTEEKELYKNLSIDKGIKFESKEYVMGEPIGTDTFQILENGEVILEKEIIISD